MNEAEAKKLVGDFAVAVAYRGDDARVAAGDKIIAALVGRQAEPSLATPAELNDIISGVLRVHEGWANTHYMEVAKLVDAAAVLRVTGAAAPTQQQPMIQAALDALQVAIEAWGQTESPPSAIREAVEALQTYLSDQQPRK